MSDHRTALSEITNTRPVFRRTTTKSPEEKSTPPKSPSESRFNVSWSRDLVLEFLWWPLGPWTLELSSDHPNLIPIMEQNRNWIILFVKDFSDSWKPGVKYEARLRPRADLCGVSQKLFTSHPSLHSCVVVEGKGYLWLNRLEDEPFLRGNWLEDVTASARILPPLNLCLDLDDTLIFNAPVADCPVPLDYVVRDPPHLLIDDPDPSGDVCPSDSPFIRPYIIEFLQLICPFFRNVRMATFSVQARAREIARHMDPTCRTLQKNYQPDPITGQKPVANTIFARELLLQQGHCLSQQERNHIKSGSVFWLKSLEMLDLPKKGLYQRSLILDDRADVWVQSVQDNIVKISGPDKPMNIGDPKYINGFNGGELGQRMLLAIINLELKSTGSRAYLELAHGLPIPSPKRMSGHSSLNSYPTSPFVHAPTPPKIPNPSIHTPARPNTLAATASPPNKAPRSSAVAGFSHARDREQREREQMRERGLTHPRPVTHKHQPESWSHGGRWEQPKYDINTSNRIPFAPLVYIS